MRRGEFGGEKGEMLPVGGNELLEDTADWKPEASVARARGAVGCGWASKVAWERSCLACWKEWDMAGVQERDLGEPMRASVRGQRRAAA